ncbi:MAG TPA: DMT family transporter [Haliscomenobacter sp.]|uniref:DMT family transporter n=1 Tax=Haliscomenobacter sp. TaxID=2717303 RepID=UPI002BAD652B|nr:DMT family transporter [Haliscomenobacter sp.]HOY17426.1 DMT family transporter [Haliscomenobacter sp.]HPH18590.1 DMT family transporter [Haliscomenobacter sp.]
MNTTSSPAMPMWRAYLVLGILSLVWGTSFILIKKSLEFFTPVQVACLRMSLSALAFVPVLIYNRKRMDWSRLPLLIVLGLCSSALPAILFSTAQQKISSATAGVLNSLTPLFTMIIGVLMFNVKVKWLQVIGILLGLAGAACLILMGKGGIANSPVGYALLIVLATLCYATGTNLIASKFRDMDSLLVSAGSFGTVGVPMGIYLLLGTDFIPRLAALPNPWLAMGYVATLSWVGTVLATIIFFKVIQQTSAIFGATVAYLMPIVAILWGVLDGEKIGLLHVVCMAIILLGVSLSRKPA